MFEAATQFFTELIHNFRAVDAIDILLIAVPLYCALVWFGEATSRRMLAGVTVLAVIYLAARMFDMHLTSLVFHTGFTVLLILLIVVFQEDLRRMLSRLAVWMSLSRGKLKATSELEIIAESVFSLAKARIGALLVFPGQEVLDRHLSGGERLDGRISRPLLDSIFDPSSDGHDGAAVVEGDRITRFGAHLPISTNLAAIAGRGTRHSAALGLSECSDAVVLVVSEERGAVSIARGGVLQAVESQAELLRLLEDSPALHREKDQTAGWMRLLTAHWRMKVLALAMAMIAWFVLAYDPTTVARTFDVPIVYQNPPAGLVLEKPVGQAKLTLSGTEANFRFISPETLKITIDLSEQEKGSNVVELDEENVQLPTGVEIDSIEPDILWLILREQLPKPEGP